MGSPRSSGLPLFGEFNVANFAAATAAACLAGASIDDVGRRVCTANGSAGPHAVRTIAAAAVGRDRFCAHARRAGEGADRREAPHRRPNRLCIRMRRRSRPRQAAVDGAGGRSGCRSCVGHQRQSAVGRSCGIAAEIVAGFQGRIAVEVELDRGVAIRNAIASAAQGPMSWWSPEKVMSHTRKLPAAVIRISDLQVVQQIFATQSGHTRLNAPRRHTVIFGLGITGYSCVRFLSSTDG